MDAMDKQYAAAVILILVGFGMIQLDDGSESSFLLGFGIGTVIMALVWIVRIIIRDMKRR